MILCIDRLALKTSKEVQKDVKLEELLNNHTKYFDSVEKALDNKYVPLDFSVTVRSMFSNLVLSKNTEESRKSFYTNLTRVEQFVHKGYDLIMFLSSIGVMHNIDYKFGFDDLMMKHSQFQPIGLYNPNPEIINPIIYTHIILSDEGAEEFKDYLKKDREMIPISEMKNYLIGNIEALLDTIIEVGEDQDEQCDNN